MASSQEGRRRKRGRPAAGERVRFFIKLTLDPQDPTEARLIALLRQAPLRKRAIAIKTALLSGGLRMAEADLEGDDDGLVEDAMAFLL